MMKWIKAQNFKNLTLEIQILKLAVYECLCTRNFYHLNLYGQLPYDKLKISPRLFYNKLLALSLQGKKGRKTAKIRNRCNQVPHLTQDTTWESNKNTINTINKCQDVSPAGDHKVAMNRRESMRNTRHKNPQMIHKRSTALERSKNTGGLNKN